MHADRRTDEEEMPWPEGDILLDLTISLIVSGSRPMPLPARFIFDPRFPLAVVLEMPQADGSANRWSFGRDLLQAGLLRPSGEGDVRIWPPCRCSGRPHARILLRDAFASALLDVPVQPLWQWLQHTWRVVPRQEEARWSDRHITIEKLLSDS
ncbi:SsgA family sporulation/cell division regulator [Streptomyces bauhiniae]|uniref:SsgA family sporulation/cell division regulator n=1 Tax=Streptomyces bauhiniae TaxID=2340725 RepID=A0A7K3QQ47_9ACTN|nr:SsgA family sporulation/cell division regulator [Streptomyces bauhiniae]NEB92021.1 SsgA family sporulation/cell division regulator [Streptomyces bauhiniae]